MATRLLLKVWDTREECSGCLEHTEGPVTQPLSWLQPGFQNKTLSQKRSYLFDDLSLIAGTQMAEGEN